MNVIVTTEGIADEYTRAALLMLTEVVEVELGVRGMSRDGTSADRIERIKNLLGVRP